MPNKAIFAARLIDIRNNKNVQAQDVAAAIGVTKSAYSLYETGKGYPTVEKLVAICDYLEVSMDYLVGRSEDSNIQ